MPLRFGRPSSTPECRLVGSVEPENLEQQSSKYSAKEKAARACALQTPRFQKSARDRRRGGGAFRWQAFRSGSMASPLGSGGILRAIMPKSRNTEVFEPHHQASPVALRFPPEHV